MEASLFRGVLIAALVVATLGMLAVAPTVGDAATLELTIKLRGPNTGAVSVTPLGVLCNSASGTECRFAIASGTTLTLFANVPWPSTPGTFSAGTGSAARCATSACTFTMTTPSALTATFDHSLPFESLGVVLSGDGTGRVLMGNTMCGKASAETASCTSMYARGTLARLIPQPDPGSTFRWLPGLCSGTGECGISLTASRTVRGEFRRRAPPGVATMTVEKAGNGGGRVTSRPGGIVCGTDCSHRYSVGTRITLRAEPVPNSIFAGWSGGRCETTPACTFRMQADRTVTATFVLRPQVMLSVVRSGTGTGTVRSEPPGIRCGRDCLQRYGPGTEVTLIARPAPGSVFAGWTGAACGTSPRCAITIEENRTVTARFDAVQVTLTVEKTGTGSGRVSSTTPGIQCGRDCLHRYAPGAHVTLRAHPKPGSVFGGWTGGGCGTAPVCSVTVDGDTRVTARFDPGAFRLTVQKGGTGTGVVSSDPAGVNCGVACQVSLAQGTAVTLRAIRSAGSAFVGWTGGPCSGTGPCSFTMTSNVTATASFAARTAARTTDSTGTTTLAARGRTIPVRIIDEITGRPVSGLSVALGLDPRVAGRAIVVIADAVQDYPVQAIMLEAALAADAVATAEPPSPLVIKARTGTEVVVSAVTEALQTGLLGTAPPPDPDGTDLANLLLSALQALRSSNVFLPPPLTGVFPSVVEESPEIPIADVTAELARRRLALVSEGLHGWFLSYGVPNPFSPTMGFLVSMAPSLFQAALNEAIATVWQMEDASAVKFLKIRIGGVVVEWPVPVFFRPPRNVFPPNPNLRVIARTDTGAPVSGGSLELVCKTVLGVGIKAVLDTGGRADVPVTLGDCAGRVGATGFRPATANLSMRPRSLTTWRPTLRRAAGPQQFTLTVGVQGEGTVNVTGGGTTCGPGCYRFTAGATASLTAHPDTGWRFVGWSGACSGTGPCSVAMTADRSVTARFERSGSPPPASLQIFEEAGLLPGCIEDRGSVVVSQTLIAFGGSPPAGYTWTLSPGSTFPPGTTVEPLTGIFKWTGGVLIPGTHSFTMTVSDGSRTAQGTFTFRVNDLRGGRICGAPAQPFTQSPAGPARTLPDAVAGRAYGSSLFVQVGWTGSISSRSLHLPLRWSLLSGALSPGLVIDMSRGVVRGTPLSSALGQTFTFRVQVENDAGEVASDGPVYSITVR